MPDNSQSNNDTSSEQYRIYQMQIVAKLHLLTERQKRVVSLRFGLIDGYARTREEVGKQFNVDAARIQDIEIEALRRIWEIRPATLEDLNLKATVERDS